jgi:hypothetical protein
MNLLPTLLSIVRMNDEAKFTKQFPGCFFVRQRHNEASQFLRFHTPRSLPLPDAQTLQPTKEQTRGRVVVFRSDEEFCEGFCVNEIKKQGQNAFSAGITIGRATNNDIVIPSTTVSKFHAWVQKDPALRAYSCFDANSRFGLTVDGVQIQGHTGRVLASGSRISLGDVTLTFLDSAATFRWIKARLALIKPLNTN